jgi:hypothetical protein
MSVFKQANQLLREGNYVDAIELYQRANYELPAMAHIIESNIKLAQFKEQLQGVSLIVHPFKDIKALERFLSDFFALNTFLPIELITIEQDNQERMENILVSYVDKIPLRRIVDEGKRNLVDLRLYASQEANYPNLLFIGEGVHYNSDILSSAVLRLAKDPSIISLRTKQPDAAELLEANQNNKSELFNSALVLIRKSDFIKN